jgi:hypothetical protein
MICVIGCCHHHSTQPKCVRVLPAGPRDRDARGISCRGAAPVMRGAARRYCGRGVLGAERWESPGDGGGNDRDAAMNVQLYTAGHCAAEWHADALRERRRLRGDGCVDAGGDVARARRSERLPCSDTYSCVCAICVQLRHSVRASAGFTRCGVRERRTVVPRREATIPTFVFIFFSRNSRQKIEDRRENFEFHPSPLCALAVRATDMHHSRSNLEHSARHAEHNCAFIERRTRTATTANGRSGARNVVRRRENGTHTQRVLSTCVCVVLAHRLNNAGR